ncbi:hypothetical protein Agub_g3072 [Astrephomene gubernaculifera]|uniref:MI domain-containing protein n=1 Tax=Astrephomene gubernaculifera TaxID=47775 RepID=A0AAD3HIK2_9CHLO|nr:hypothetical protein Agub_g3072 [Astrephomene gubernaculifera]
MSSLSHRHNSPRDGPSRRRRQRPSPSSGSGNSTSGSSSSGSDSTSSSDITSNSSRRKDLETPLIGFEGADRPLQAAADPALGPETRQRQLGQAEAKPQPEEAHDQAHPSVFDPLGSVSGTPDRTEDQQQLGQVRRKGDDRRRGEAEGDRYAGRRLYDNVRDCDTDRGGDDGSYRPGDEDYRSRREVDSANYLRQRHGGRDGGSYKQWCGERDHDRIYNMGNDRHRIRNFDRLRDRGGDRDREWERGIGGGERYLQRGKDRREDERGRLKRPREEGDEGPRRGTSVAAEQEELREAAGGAAAGSSQAAAAEPGVRKPIPAGKTGGVYIPPFKLARMMAEQRARDKSSPEYQRLTWEALKKSLNGIINKVNVVNVKNILPEVFRENMIRGRGLFCRSLMKSQAASPSFTPVYAALVAVVNTKFPEIGELLLSRLILQFKRSFKRNDKPVCTAAAKFIAHMVNQGVAHEVLALEVLILLLEQPSEDSVEMAVEFVREVGAHLQDVVPQGLHGVFERFRAILHEGAISKRVQFIIEGMFALRKAGFEASGYPALRPELDLVEADDQITHELGLDDELQAQALLDVFRVDPSYEEEERKYAAIAREILGEEAEEEDEGGAGEEEGVEGSGAAGMASSEEEEYDEPGGGGGAGSIHDETATNLVNLRRTIYLTLMSSFDFEEAGHKLLKIGIQPGQEIELVTMIIECCSQERTFKRFYGLLAQRFCYLSRAYAETFEDCFRKQYSVIHRLETNKLRNVSCLFAHLLATDALPWSALTVVRLTEEDTTSSSRIFIKYLFQELSSTMGLVKLNQRLNDPAFSPWFEGIFPRDSLQHMRFSINFFTSIGLGGVTDVMRENYKAAVAAQTALQQQQVARRMLGSDNSSNSSSSSGSDSSSSGGGSLSDSDSGDSLRRRNDKRNKGGKGKGGRDYTSSGSGKKRR